MVSSKGHLGILFQNYVLLYRYGISYPQTYTGVYDLIGKVNTVSNRNVSIKASKTNTIYCSSVLNFVNSINLELVVINYKVVTGNRAVVKEYYLFSNLDLFFVNLKKTIDFTKLSELDLFLKTIKAPFTKEERKYVSWLAKKIVISEYSGFRIATKLSSTNKRIQCTLKLDSLCKLVNYQYLDLNKDPL